MTTPRLAAGTLFVLLVSLVAATASAQPLGTYRWQLEPYCNVVSVNINHANGVYTLDGWDDQCGTAPRAPLVGAATFNSDGTIGLGLSVVTAPGGAAVHVSATITLQNGNGPWRDSAGHEGQLSFNPTIPAAGSRRPDSHINPGNGNTRVGTGALPADIGPDNTALGVEAMDFFARFGPPVPSGSRNTAIGAGALFNISGSDNIAVGAGAGCAPNNAMLASVSNNIYIGTDVCEPDPSFSNTIRIGRIGGHTRAFMAGVWGVTPMFPTVPVMIDGAGQLGTVSSSRSVKENIENLGDASRAIFDLRPVQFTYKQPFADGTTPIQYGLIAEEVAEVLPDLVAKSPDGTIETVKYHVLPTLLLAEVQRLERERNAADQARTVLAQQVSEQAATLAELRSLIETLQRQVAAARPQ